jgi:hypothetical protein
MFKLLNDILLALNNTAYVWGIFCDLQKAFDCVNHDLVMKKLKFYGIAAMAMHMASFNHILVTDINESYWW